MLILGPMLGPMLGQTLVTGLLVGAMLALLSAGLTLIFGVMRVVNFAQGEFVMLGMYAAVFLIGALGLGPYLLAPYLLAPVIFLGFLVVGAAIYWLVLRHLNRPGLGGPRAQDAQLILTLGLSLVIQNLALMALGSRPYLLGTAFTGAWDVGGLLFNKQRLLGAGVAVVAIVGLLWLLRGTRTGRVLRATAEDAQAAVYMGIDVGRANLLAFSIGTALAGVGGGVLATYYPTQPYVGEDFIVLMFVAVVLGGLGSVAGAVAGGLLIGLAQAAAPLLLPLDLQNVVVFAIFLLVLFVRPHGLFGRQARV